MVETLPSARLSEMIATTPASPCGSCLDECCRVHAHNSLILT
jgi:hypothetical protein